MRPRFTGACLVTDDVLGLAAFYARVLDSSVEGNETFAIVSTPGATLSLYATTGMEQMAPASMTGAGAGGVLLEFEVEDVDQAYARFQPIPPTPDPEKVVRRYFQRLLVDRDLSICDELLASDYVDHDAPPDTPPGPHATRAR